MLICVVNKVNMRRNVGLFLAPCLFLLPVVFFYPPRIWKVVDPNGILLCWKKKDVAIVKARRRDLLTKYKELL